MTRLSCIAAMLAALALGACDDSPPVDHYVLALNWEPAFCQFNADKPECRELDGADLAATRPAIHGLWPDTPQSTRIRHCGVEERVKLLDQRNRWCELPDLDLSAETREALDRAMPGARSCLDRHEWTEHGTCTGLDAEHYFSTTLRLAAAVQKSAFGDLLAANIGREVPRRDLIAAFEAAFGPGAGEALTLLCGHAGGQSRLSEIRITLERSAVEGSLGADVLRRTASGTAGSCPANVLIDAVGP